MRLTVITGLVLGLMIALHAHISVSAQFRGYDARYRSCGKDTILHHDVDGDPLERWVDLGRAEDGGIGLFSSEKQNTKRGRLFYSLLGEVLLPLPVSSSLRNWCSNLNTSRSSWLLGREGSESRRRLELH